MPRGVQVRTKNHGLGNHGNLPGPGPGRPKGVPNKFNGQLKEALLSAFNGAHPDGLASWVLQEAKANPTAAWRFRGGSSPSRRKAHWTPLLSFVMSMKPRIKRSWCSRAGGLSSLWHCSGMGSGFGGQKLPGEALGDRSSDFASALASPSSRPTYMDMPWHLSVARSRSDPPAGFILPCRPTLVAAPPRRRGLLSPRPLVGFGWRRGLRERGRRVEPRQRRAQRIRRGAWGYRSPSMTPRIAAVTAASSSLGRSIVGMPRTLWSSSSSAPTSCRCSAPMPTAVVGAWVPKLRPIPVSASDRPLPQPCAVSTRTRPHYLDQAHGRSANVTYAAAWRGRPW